MKKVLLFTIFLFSYITSFGHVIHGKVNDKIGQPIAYTNIIVENLSDSSYVCGTTSDTQGLFHVDIPNGKMLIKCSCIGYDDFYSKVDNLPNIIIMQDATNNLAEITIKGHIHQYKMTAEGLLTNVEGTMLSKMGTAEDVLKHVPSVIKKDEEWEVFGKGQPIIYLNGRQLQDISELDNIKSSDVKSVEVIHNPGAKYSASVGAVVRIKTIRAKGDGIGFDYRLHYTYNKYNSIKQQLKLNYRHNNLNIFGLYTYSNNRSFQDAIFEQTTKVDTLWHQYNNNYDIFKTEYHYLQSGLSYDINDTHSLGVKYSILLTSNQWDHGYFDSQMTANQQYYDYMQTSSHDENKDRPIHRINAYYIGDIGKTNIDFNIDLYFNHDIKHSYMMENSEEYESREIVSESSIRNRMLASKLVMTSPMFSGKLSYGAEYINTNRNDDYNVNRTDIISNSHEQLKEQTISPFAEYKISSSIGDITAGLRYEYVRFRYYNNGTYISEQSRTFGDLYPSINYSKQIGKTNWQLSYSIKTLRPSYLQLSNNISYSNRFTYQTGNPLLNNQTDHVLSLDGTWKFFQLMMSYKDSRNAIIYWAEQMANNQAITLINYRNENSIKNIVLYVSAAPKIGIWEPQFNVGMTKQWLSLHTDINTYKLNKPIFVVNLDNAFSLPWGINANIDFAYQSKGDSQNAQVTKEQYGLDFGISKSFLNNAITLEIKGNDLLYKMWDSESLYSQKMQLEQSCRRGSRELSVTIRYKFNIAHSKYKGAGAGNEEKDRL